MPRRAPFAAILALAALCAGCAPTLTATPTLTSGASLATGKRDPVTVFHPDDRIVQLVDVTWADPTVDGGRHECQWEWFRDGRLVSSTPVRRLWFDHMPSTLHTERPVAPLGPGHYTVETIVDGDVVATSAFTIAG